MSKKLYVGNMNYSTTEQELMSLFIQFGNVSYANIVYDKVGQHKGYGFVEMDNNKQGKTAQMTLDGKKFQGRKLHVSDAYERRPSRRKSFASKLPKSTTPQRKGA